MEEEEIEDQEQTKKEESRQMQKPLARTARERVSVERGTRDGETVSAEEMTTESVAARKERG